MQDKRQKGLETEDFCVILWHKTGQKKVWRIKD